MTVLFPSVFLTADTTMGHSQYSDDLLCNQEARKNTFNLMVLWDFNNKSDEILEKTTAHVLL